MLVLGEAEHEQASRSKVAKLSKKLELDLRFLVAYGVLSEAEQPSTPKVFWWAVLSVAEQDGELDYVELERGARPLLRQALSLLSFLLAVLSLDFLL